MGRRGLSVAVALSICLAAGGCSGSGDESGSPVTVGPDDTSSVDGAAGGSGAAASTDPGDAASPDDALAVSDTYPPGSVEAQVVEAHLAQASALIEILGDPDPTNPLIDRHYTGRTKEQVLGFIGELYTAGRHVELPEDPALYRVEVQDVRIVDEAHVILVECLTDGGLIVDDETGEVLDDDVVTSHLMNDYVLEDGLWKLEHTTDAGPAERPCDG